MRGGVSVRPETLHTDAEGGRRYPGIAPFEDSALHRRLFRGRDQDGERLRFLVLAEPLVVVFGRSGAGKTSLINGRLLEALRIEGYFPVVTRVNQRDVEPSRLIRERVVEAARAEGLRFTPGPDERLWTFFKTTPFRGPDPWKDDAPRTPILILDQFEEFFTMHPRAARGAFVEHFAELIRGRRRGLEGVATDPALSDDPPSVKVLITIRDDFVGHLDEFSEQLPQILRTRFRVQPLTGEQAAAAIEEPAAVTLAEVPELATPPFSFTPGTVERLVAYLSRTAHLEDMEGHATIEPMHLQIVSAEIESRVAEAASRRSMRPSGHITFSYEELGGDEGVEAIIRRFYLRQLEAIEDAATRTRLRRVCEEALIDEEGARHSVEDRRLARDYRVSLEAIDLLVRRRILRVEERARKRYVEISHDLLVRPIQAAREDRHKEEERAEAERRAANWKRVAVSVVALFTLLVVAAGGWGMAWLANQRQRAEAQKVETERQLAYVRAREELQQGRDPKRALAYLARYPDPGDSTPRQLILADAVEQGIPVAAFRDHGQVSVSAVAVEAGTSLVLSGDERGRVLAWDADTGTVEKELTAAMDERSAVRSIGFAGAAGIVMVARASGAVELWRRQGWGRFDGLEYPGRLRGATITRDGKRLLTLGEDHEAKVWQLDGKPPTRLDVSGQVTAADISPTGDIVAAALTDGLAYLWDVETDPRGAQRLRRRRATLPFPTTGLTVTFGPDGHELIVGAEEQARLWLLEYLGPRGPQVPVAILDHPSTKVIGAAFSDNGSLVATVSDDEATRLWSWKPLQGRREARVVAGHQGGLNAVAFGGHGAWLLTAGNDGVIMRWGVAGIPRILREDAPWLGRLCDVARICSDTDRVRSVATDARGQRIVSASQTRIKVWDGTGARPPSQRWTSAPTDPFIFASFAPDDDHVLAVTKSAVNVYDVDSGTRSCGERVGSLGEFLAWSRRETSYFSREKEAR